MSITTAPTAKTTTVRFVFKDRTLTPEQLLDQIQHHPKQVTARIKEGLRLEADPAVLDALHTTALDPYVDDDDGEVEASAVGGGVVIGALLVGFAIGFAVGYAVGSSDDASTDEPTTDSSDSGGDSGDSGDSGGSGGSGG